MIIVILPAYNEAEALPLLLDRLNRVSMRHFNFSVSVIVVDDGSADNTSERVKSTDALDVQLIVHKENRGLSEAIKTGLVAGLERVGNDDIIVIMDADNTHTPGLISRMVMLIEEGNDVVIASRFTPGARVVGVPLTRRILSMGASLLFRIVYPISGVKDYTCGYRAYRASLLREAFDYWGEDLFSEPGFSCMIDILLKLRHINAIVTEVPLILRYDFKLGKSKMDIRKTIMQTLSLLVRRRLGRMA